MKRRKMVVGSLGGVELVVGGVIGEGHERVVYLGELVDGESVSPAFCRIRGFSLLRFDHITHLSNSQSTQSAAPPCQNGYD